LARDIEEKAKRLQKANPDEFARLNDRLRIMLGEGAVSRD